MVVPLRPLPPPPSSLMARSWVTENPIFLQPPRPAINLFDMFPDPGAEEEEVVGGQVPHLRVRLSPQRKVR